MLTAQIKKYRWTITGCLLSGVIAHGFTLVNVLQNYDNVFSDPTGYGTGIQSGRWLLSVLGNIFDWLGLTYNLPFWNGVLSILLLTAAAVLITDLFHLQDCYGFFFGAIFLSFPTVTGILFFRFTSAWYNWAVLWAVMAVWCAQKGWKGAILAIGLEAASMGLYQAYIPMTAVLFVLLLFQEAYEEHSSWKTFMKKAVYYLSVIIGGFILYFFCLKTLLFLSHRALTAYVNIDKMGQIRLSDIPNILRKCYTIFYLLPFRDYYGVTATGILKVCVLSIGLIVPGLLWFSWRKKFLHGAGFAKVLLLYFVVYPVALNGIEVICFNTRIYVLMIYSVVFLFLLPFVLLNTIQGCREAISDRVQKSCKAFQYLCVTAVAMAALDYAYVSNVNYTAAYCANQATTSYLNRFIVRVQETEGYDVSYRWALLGTFEDPSFISLWDTAVEYGGACSGNLINAYSRADYLQYLGFTYEPVEDKEIEELQKKKEVQNMPCYPNAGSIKIIGDVIVIKLCEE